MATVAALDVRVRANTRDADRGLRSLRKSLGGIAKVAAAAVAAAAISTTGLAAAGLKEFRQFDKGIREVYTLLPGLSQQTYDNLSKQARDFSRSTGAELGDVVGSLYQAISAGVPRDNVFDFLQTAQKAAVGGVSDLTTSVDALSSVVNAYGAEVLSTEQASDIFFATIRGGKTDFTQLGTTIGRIAPLAAGLGVPFEHVGATLATLTAQGINTSESVTGLRAVFTSLAKPVGAAEEILDKVAGSLGHRNIEQALRGAGLPAVLSAITDATGGTVTGLNEVFGSVEAANAVLALISDSGAAKFTAELENMANAAGGTNAAFEVLDASLDASLNRFRSARQVLFANIGEQIAPDFKELVDFVTEDVMPVVERSVVAGFGLIARVFRYFTRGDLRGLVDSWRSAGDRVAAETTGLRRVVVALLGAWQAVFRVLSTLWQRIVLPVWEAVAPRIGRLLQGLGGLVVRYLEAMTQGLTTFADFIDRDWSMIWADMVTMATDGLATVGEILRTGWETLVEFLVGIWEGLTSRVVGIWEDLRDRAEEIWEEVKGRAEAIWGDILEVIGAPVERVRDVVVAAWSTIAERTEPIWMGIRDTVTGAAEAIRDVTQPVWATIVAGATAAAETVKAIWDGVRSFVTGLFSGPGGDFRDAGDQLLDAGRVQDQIRTQGRVASAVENLTDQQQRTIAVLDELQATETDTEWLEALSKLRGDVLRGQQVQLEGAVAPDIAAVERMGRLAGERTSRIGQDLRSEWERTTARIREAWAEVVGVAEGALGAISGAAQATWNGITTGAATLAGVLSGIWQGIPIVAAAAWGGVSSAAQTAWDAVTAGAATLAGVLASIWQGVVTLAGTLWGAVRVAATAGWAGLTAGWALVSSTVGSLWAGALAMAQMVWAGVRVAAVAGWAGITAGWALVVSTVGSLWAGALATAQMVWAAVRGAAVAAWAGLTAGWALVTSTVGSLWAGVLATAQNVWAAVRSAAAAAWVGIAAGWALVSSAVGGLWAGLEATAQKVWAGVRTAAVVSWAGITAGWALVSSTVGSLWAGVLATAQKVWAGVRVAAVAGWVGLTAGWALVSSTVGSLWAGILATAQMVWAGVRGAAAAGWAGITAGWALVSSVVGGLWAGIMATAEMVWAAVRSAAAASWAGITAGWALVSSVVSGLWAGIMATAQNVWTGVRAAAAVSWAGITAGWALVSSTVGSLWAGVLATAQMVWAGVRVAAVAGWVGLTAGWALVSSTVGSLWAGALTMAQGTWAAVRSALVASWAGITAAWARVTSTVGSLWAGAVTVAQMAWAAVRSAVVASATGITAAWAVVTSTVGSLWAGAVGIAQAAWGAVRSAVMASAVGISAAWAVVTSTVSSLWAGALGVAQMTWAAVRAAAVAAWAGITAAWALVTSTVSSLWAGALTMAQMVWAGVRVAAVAAWAGITAGWALVTSTVGSLWNGAVGVAQRTWAAVRSAAAASAVGISAAWAVVTSTVSSLWAGAEQAAATIWGGISSIATAAATAVTDAWNAVIGVVETTVGAVTDAINTVTGLLNNLPLVNIPQIGGGGAAGPGISKRDFLEGIGARERPPTLLERISGGANFLLDQLRFGAEAAPAPMPEPPPEPAESQRGFFGRLVDSAAAAGAAVVDTVEALVSPSTNLKDNLQEAIALQESGGDFGAVNFRSGALGRYQFMPHLLPEFFSQAGQPALSPEAFLEDPGAQDALMQARLDRFLSGGPQSLESYGITGATDEDRVAYMAARHYGFGDQSMAELVTAFEQFGSPLAALLDESPQGQYPSTRQYAEEVLAHFRTLQEPRAQVRGTSTETIVPLPPAPPTIEDPAGGGNAVEDYFSKTSALTGTQYASLVAQRFIPGSQALFGGARSGIRSVAVDPAAGSAEATAGAITTAVVAGGQMLAFELASAVGGELAPVIADAAAAARAGETSFGAGAAEPLRDFLSDSDKFAAAAEDVAGIVGESVSFGAASGARALDSLTENLRRGGRPASPYSLSTADTATLQDVQAAAIGYYDEAHRQLAELSPFAGIDDQAVEAGLSSLEASVTTLDDITKRDAPLYQDLGGSSAALAREAGREILEAGLLQALPTAASALATGSLAVAQTGAKGLDAAARRGFEFLTSDEGQRALSALGGAYQSARRVGVNFASGAAQELLGIDLTSDGEALPAEQQAIVDAYRQSGGLLSGQIRGVTRLATGAQKAAEGVAAVTRPVLNVLGRAVDAVGEGADAVSHHFTSRIEKTGAELGNAARRIFDPLGRLVRRNTGIDQLEELDTQLDRTADTSEMALSRVASAAEMAGPATQAAMIEPLLIGDGALVPGLVNGVGYLSSTWNEALGMMAPTAGAAGVASSSALLGPVISGEGAMVPGLVSGVGYLSAEWAGAMGMMAPTASAAGSESSAALLGAVVSGPGALVPGLTRGLGQLEGSWGLSMGVITDVADAAASSASASASRAVAAAQAAAAAAERAARAHIRDRSPTPTRVRVTPRGPGRGTETQVGITALARGGITTGPTLGLIGEEGPEAVLPLDGLEERLAAAFAEALAKQRGGDGRPLEVKLIVDGRVLARQLVRRIPGALDEAGVR